MLSVNAVSTCNANFKAQEPKKENFGKKVLKGCAEALDDFASKTDDPYIRVEGKKYYVTENPFSIFKKETVDVNGKKYGVKKVPSLTTNDKTKKVVIINGKVYEVKGGERYPFDERPTTAPQGNI